MEKKDVRIKRKDANGRSYSLFLTSFSFLFLLSSPIFLLP